MRHFTQRPGDKDVVRAFLTGFDVTFADVLTRGAAQVACFILKPETQVSAMLGIERELLLVYSPHKQLQARTVQLHDELARQHRTRIDPMGSVIVADAANAVQFVREVETSEPDRAPIAAFSVSDLDQIRNQTQLLDALGSQFFRRDLFGLESPLRNDALFFGRKDLVAELLDRLRTGQNSGLFGLRRMGKTSILYAMGRRCAQEELAGLVYQDMSFPGLYEGRWRNVLQNIVRAAFQGLPTPASQRLTGIKAMKQDYSEDQAAYHFRNDVLKLMAVMPNQRMWLALDEIENITFDLSPAPHWSVDFLPFWRTLRAFHQETQGRFCFVVAGVSPHLLECDVVGRFDNPLFGTVKSYYVAPFGADSVREMVRRIARSMGLKPEEGLYRLLAEDFGGHPYLTRQACSYLVTRLPKTRPAKLSIELYQKERANVVKALNANVRHVLNALKRWYPGEYEQLRNLATDPEGWSQRLEQSPTVIEHLEGYGLVRQNAQRPSITIGLVNEYLAREPEPNSELPEGLRSAEDLLSEIMLRRDPLERKLRGLIATTLSVQYGNKAPGRALDSFTKDRRDVLAGYGYQAMWKETYLKELIALLEREWPLFQTFFACDKADIVVWLRTINDFREDAHAGDVPEDYVGQLRFCFRKIEEKLRAVSVETG